MKATPITEKARFKGSPGSCCGIPNCGHSSSPAKANMALIHGAADIGASKSYVDPGKMMEAGLDKGVELAGENAMAGIDFSNKKKD